MQLVLRRFALHFGTDPINVRAVGGREAFAAIVEGAHVDNGTYSTVAVPLSAITSTARLRCRSPGVPCRAMGLSRDVTRIELTTRTAGPDDGAAIAGVQLWIVSWTKRERGSERDWAAPHVSEAGARRMVRNLLQELAEAVDPAEAFVDRTGCAAAEPGYQSTP